MLDKFITLTKLFSLPIIIYIVFFSIRIAGFQPASESEIGDWITSNSFIFSASISYFIVVFQLVLKPEHTHSPVLWWWSLSALMLVLAVDEIYMLHENIGIKLGIKDSLVLLFYAGFLGILLLFRLSSVLKRTPLIFFSLFAINSFISIVSDYLLNEGTILIMGKDISYEQLCESFGALFLACAVVTLAMQELTANKLATRK